MPSFLPYQYSAEMAAQQDTGKAEDALFLADMLLAQVKVSVYLKQACSIGDDTDRCGN